MLFSSLTLSLFGSTSRLLGHARQVAEEGGEELSLEGEGCDWADQGAADQFEAVVETADISEQLKQAIRRPLGDFFVRPETQVDRAKLVLFGPDFVSARAGWPEVQISKLIVV